MEIYNNDEQQAEAIKNWIKENGRAVLLGAAIGLVGMFGWRYYNEYHQGKMEAASAAYDLVIKDLDQNKDKAFPAVSEFVSNYSGSAQGDLAALQLASAAVKAGKLDVAVTQLQTVADKGNAAVKPIAAIRLARVLGEQGKFADAQKRLDSVTQKAYKAVVAEVRGDLYLHRLNYPAVGRLCARQRGDRYPSDPAGVVRAYRGLRPYLYCLCRVLLCVHIDRRQLRLCREQSGVPRT